MERSLSRTSALVLFMVTLAAGILLAGTVTTPCAQAELFPIDPLPIDLTPDVQSVSPADDATEVLLTTNVIAYFDRAILSATIDEDSFYLTYLGTMNIGGHTVKMPIRVDADVTVATDKKSAALNPDANLEPGRAYTAHLTDDIKAMWGALGPYTLTDSPYTWSFTTVTRPEITSRIPAADAANVPLSQVISVTFSKAVTGDFTVPFTDLGDDLLPGPGVVNSLYPHEYVAVAYRNGITNGLTATGFGPYVGIKRAQVVTMMVRAVDTLHPGLLLTPGSGYGTLGNFDATHGANMKS